MVYSCAVRLSTGTLLSPLGGDVHQDQHALVVDIDEALGLELQEDPMATSPQSRARPEARE